MLHCDLGELPRSLVGRQVLVEVEEELGEHHLRDEGFRKSLERLALGEPARRRKRGDSGTLALRRRHQTRNPGRERPEARGYWVRRRSIIVQSRLEGRLAPERDGDQPAERREAPGDGGPPRGGTG